MKRLLIVLAMIAMVSCIGMQSATSYHYVPKINKDKDVGKITQIVEKRGYSIITVEERLNPIYVCGRLNAVRKPYLSPAFIMEQGDIKHFVYEGRRYLIDIRKSNL